MPIPPHSRAWGDLRERGPLYSPWDDSQCQKQPGTGAQLNHSCSNYTNCPRDKTIALVCLVRAWREPNTFFFVKAFSLEVHFQNKVSLTPSLSRLLPGKCNLFFLERRALKEMLPRRVRSHCGCISPPPVKEVTLYFHYTDGNWGLNSNQLPEKHLGCSPGSFFLVAPLVPIKWDCLCYKDNPQPHASQALWPLPHGWCFPTARLSRCSGRVGERPVLNLLVHKP